MFSFILCDVLIKSWTCFRFLFAHGRENMECLLKLRKLFCCYISEVPANELIKVNSF